MRAEILTAQNFDSNYGRKFVTSLWSYLGFKKSAQLLNSKVDRQLESNFRF